MSSITLTDGTNTITLLGEKGARAEYDLSQRSGQVGIPNRIGDFYQFLGRDSIEVQVSGFNLPDATWYSDLSILASWAAVGTLLTFSFSMMPIPFTTLSCYLKSIKPSVKIGEQNFCQITAKIIEA